MTTWQSMCHSGTMLRDDNGVPLDALTLSYYSSYIINTITWICGNELYAYIN